MGRVSGRPRLPVWEAWGLHKSLLHASLPGPEGSRLGLDEGRWGTTWGWSGQPEGASHTGKENSVWTDALVVKEKTETRIFM